MYRSLDLTLDQTTGLFDYVARYYALSSGGTLNAVMTATGVPQAALVAALANDELVVAADFTAAGYPPA